MNYVNKVEWRLDRILKMEKTVYSDLLRVYALLVFTVGVDCTNKNIHDAWSVWQNETNPNHMSLIPFEKLPAEVQDLDIPYRDAVIKVAKDIL